MSGVARFRNGPRRWLVLLGVALAVLAVAGIVLFQRAASPPTPGPFYTPPDPLPAGAPGTVIRSEPVTNNLPAGAVAWRVLYLSTGLNDEPVAVSGLVIAPAEESAGPRPVIAWAQGTQGILPECGTSHRANPFELISGLNPMISEGFVVVATDYPGRGTPGIHPYLVAPVEGRAVLDSVRAARQLDAGAGERFAIWGGSQGGQAALWAAQSVQDYAPELTLLGAAAQAAALDLPGTFATIVDRRVGGVLLAQALYAWSAIYADANLEDVVKPEMRARFKSLARTCVSTPLAFLTLGSIPTPSEFLSVDLLTAEPWRTILETNRPLGPIDVPLLITHGTSDPLIPIEGSENEVARRCAAGEDVTFMRFPGVSHPGTDETAVTTIGWIEDRFAGRPTGPTCGR